LFHLVIFQKDRKSAIPGEAEGKEKGVVCKGRRGKGDSLIVPGGEGRGGKILIS